MKIEDRPALPLMRLQVIASKLKNTSPDKATSSHSSDSSNGSGDRDNWNDWDNSPF